MTIELDADELALHDYQLQHFSAILPFILRHIMFYGALAGALLSGIFYLLTFGDPPPPDPLLVQSYHPILTWYEVILNYLVRVPIGAVVGGLIAVGMGFCYARLVQATCRKQISTDYVEPYDLSLPFMVYQIVLPIPVTFLILFIATPVLWYATREHGLLFVGTSYITVLWVLSEVTRRFLKWYIPPLLPPLHE